MNISCDIIIVNWNAGSQLHACLMSIAAAQRGGIDLRRVIVVDNASRDRSTEGLSDIPLPLVMIRNRENRGFAVACNQGAAESQADFVLFLNPDTRLRSDALAKSLDFIAQPANRYLGILGIQLCQEDGRVARSCARFPAPYHFMARLLWLDRLLPGLSFIMTDWDHQETRQVDHVIGAFYLVRRSVYRQLGGFDERYFVYFEDLDFSLRARRFGWVSAYLTTTCAFHVGGGCSVRAKPERLFYSRRSLIHYCFKHFDRLSATCVTIGTLFIEPWGRLLLGVARLSGERIIETIKAYLLLWRALPEVIREIRRKGRHDAGSLVVKIQSPRGQQ